MQCFQDLRALRHFVTKHKKDSQRIGFVPTMGALHDGHLSLIDRAKQDSDIVIASIFVNPTQFDEGEDLDAYPRPIEQDIEKLTAQGCDALWNPDAKTMYPDGFQTVISLSRITNPLEGKQRPGHFDGVATVVAKLFGQVTPDIAVFGQKDYQQLLLIKQMVSDLNMPITIIGAETLRDQNGLALSSRNAYLTDEQYDIAMILNKTLQKAGERFKQSNDYMAAESEASETLHKAGFDSVDYVAIRDATTLQKPSSNTTEYRILGAAYLGRARLIDNMNI